MTHRLIDPARRIEHHRYHRHIVRLVRAARGLYRPDDDDNDNDNDNNDDDEYGAGVGVTKEAPPLRFSAASPSSASRGRRYFPNNDGGNLGVDIGIRADTGTDTDTDTDTMRPLRCFALTSEHIGTFETPMQSVIDSRAPEGDGRVEDENNDYDDDDECFNGNKGIETHGSQHSQARTSSRRCCRRRRCEMDDGTKVTETTPADFHSELVRRIRAARSRVKIAALYVGAATVAAASIDENSGDGNGAILTRAPREAELLDAIEGAARRFASSCSSAASAGVANGAKVEMMTTTTTTTKNIMQEVTILMDASRGLRRVRRHDAPRRSNLKRGTDSATTTTTTSSAEVVFERLCRGMETFDDDAGVGDGRRRARARDRDRCHSAHVSPCPRDFDKVAMDKSCNDNDGGDDDVDNDDNNSVGGGDGTKCGLYLFNALADPLGSLLPSPLNELAGVMHIKAYVMDDSLILTGANLSEEYFTDRQDRYMLFTNGAGGLVDFYSDLIDVLCKYSHRYSGEPFTHSPAKLNAEEFLNDLAAIFDGSKDFDLGGDDDDDHDHNHNDPWKRNACQGEYVAFAVPTFQAPRSLFSVSSSSLAGLGGGGDKRNLPFLSDSESTKRLLLTALQVDPSASVRISSAYLNPPLDLMSVLGRFGGDSRSGRGTALGKTGRVMLLTAGSKSHGFAPKSGKKRSSSSIKDWIPSAYQQLVNEAALRLQPRGGKVLLYERDGWTFHAKGLWLSLPSVTDARSGKLRRGGGNESGVEDDGFGQDDTMCNPAPVCAAIVGSGNYGIRSQDLDYESNCIIVMNDAKSVRTAVDRIKSSIAAEWNFMVAYSSEMDLAIESQGRSHPASLGLRAVLRLIRKIM